VMRRYLKSWNTVILQKKKSREIIEKIQESKKKEQITRAINRLREKATKSLRKKYLESCQQLKEVQVCFINIENFEIIFNRKYVKKKKRRMQRWRNKLN